MKIREQALKIQALEALIEVKINEARITDGVAYELRCKDIGGTSDEPVEHLNPNQLWPEGYTEKDFV